VADFDKHFNFYVDQSIRYLQSNTNVTLPAMLSDPETNQTTMVDLARYVKTVISNPSTIDTVNNGSVSKWNETLIRNN
jgi:hypothetical protein